MDRKLEIFEAVEKNEDSEIPIKTENIQNMVYVVRGKQVMLDSDLAKLYQVETFNLNKARKRNEKRFPADFCFQLTKDEYQNLKFQFGISSCTGNEHGGRRTLPYAYTEQGIAMLSAVLRSDIAIQVSIKIMQTFVEMRKYMAHTSLILEKVNQIEIRQMTDQQRNNERFEQVFNYISDHQESRQKIFFDGQIFEAFSLLAGIIGQAQTSIVLIDGYVDIETLNILAKKQNRVKVDIYTSPTTRLTARDIDIFNTQYPMLSVRYTGSFHDRFLILDNTKAYHIGASIKDAGKKCFGITQIEDAGLIKDILARAELTSGTGRSEVSHGV